MRLSPPNKLRELREARGLSQQELGRRLGVGNQQISKLETGRLRMSTLWMARLAEVLAVPPAAIYPGLPENGVVEAREKSQRIDLNKSELLPQAELVNDIVHLVRLLPPRKQRALCLFLELHGQESWERYMLDFPHRKIEKVVK